MTEEQYEDFEDLATALIELMKAALGPHDKIIITQNRAEILTGIYGVVAKDEEGEI
jgi:hypothetical protein